MWYCVYASTLNAVRASFFQRFLLASGKPSFAGRMAFSAEEIAVGAIKNTGLGFPRPVFSPVTEAENGLHPKRNTAFSNSRFSIVNNRFPFPDYGRVCRLCK
jgi:hypothetical protein